MTDEEFVALSRREADAALKKVEDKAEAARLRKLYRARQLASSEMRNGGRLLFFGGALLLFVYLWTLSLGDSSIVTFALMACAATLSLGATMWMLGALEQRLYDIIFELRRHNSRQPEDRVPRQPTREAVQAS